MNKECELCIKRKTMYCPNSSKCYNTEEKPFYQNRIMLLQENQQLKNDNALMKAGLIQIRDEQFEQYKSVLDEIREYIEHEWFKRGQLGIIDKSFQEWQLKDILQILDKVKK